jgi:hypothetical protein
LSGPRRLNGYGEGSNRREAIDAAVRDLKSKAKRGERVTVGKSQSSEDRNGTFHARAYGLAQKLRP